MRARAFTFLAAVPSVLAMFACGGDTFSAADAATGPSTDAGGASDAPDGSAADAGRFCDSLPAAAPLAFCTDFDEGLPATYLWGNIASNVVGGTAVVDTGAALSPPASLLVTMPTPNASSPAASYYTVYRAFPNVPATATVHMEADVRLEAISGSDDVSFLNAKFGNPDVESLEYKVSVAATATGASVGDTPPAGDSSTRKGAHVAFTRYPVIGKWSHVRLDIDFDFGAPIVRAQIDDDAEVSFMPTTTAVTATPQLSVGIVAQPGTGRESVRFDNAVVRVTTP